MYCKKCGTQIDEKAKFCPNCGYNLAGPKDLVPVLATEASSNQSTKKKKHLVLSIVFAIIGVVPLLNIIFLPISVILSIMGFATNKNGITKTKITCAIVLIISIVISLLWMIPAITGSSLDFTTNNDLGDQDVCIHSYALVDAEVTCSSGGYATYQCSLCGEIKSEYESALGHSWSNNKCERCGITNDLELDPKNNNILTIEQIDWDINSVNGVEPSITFTNRTDKQIAYVYFTIKFYDRMGYPAYCSIRDTHTRNLKVTGPINAGEKDTRYWDSIIYNGSTAAVKPLKIEINFTDGTKQTIICTGRYWYTNSYYGGDLHE